VSWVLIIGLVRIPLLRKVSVMHMTQMGVTYETEVYARSSEAPYVQKSCSGLYYCVLTAQSLSKGYKLQGLCWDVCCIVFLGVTFSLRCGWVHHLPYMLEGWPYKYMYIVGRLFLYHVKVISNWFWWHHPLASPCETVQCLSYVILYFVWLLVPGQIWGDIMNIFDHVG